MRHATQTIKLSKFGMVYYNNVLCSAILTPFILLNGEAFSFAAVPTLHTFAFALQNLSAGFFGFFLNFASLSCVAATGPTTYAIIGSLNKIPTSILGWLLFHAAITPENWFFIAVAMTGGFIYSWAEIRQKSRVK